MALPWDGMREGMVGKTIDSIDKALKLKAPIMRKALIGKKASQMADKLPYKGMFIAGAVAGPVVAAAGPVAGTAVGWAVWAKRRGAAKGGYYYPFVRSIGPKK